MLCVFWTPILSYSLCIYDIYINSPYISNSILSIKTHASFNCSVAGFLYLKELSCSAPSSHAGVKRVPREAMSSSRSVKVVRTKLAFGLLVVALLSRSDFTQLSQRYSKVAVKLIYASKRWHLPFRQHKVREALQNHKIVFVVGFVTFRASKKPKHSALETFGLISCEHQHEMLNLRFAEAQNSTFTMKSKSRSVMNSFLINYFFFISHSCSCQHGCPLLASLSCQRASNAKRSADNTLTQFVPAQ